jgi:hypothetical protein
MEQEAKEAHIARPYSRYASRLPINRAHPRTCLIIILAARSSIPVGTIRGPSRQRAVPVDEVRLKKNNSLLLGPTYINYTSVALTIIGLGVVGFSIAHNGSKRKRPKRVRSPAPE